MKNTDKKNSLLPCMAVLQANRVHLFRVLKKSVGKYQAQSQNEKPDCRISLQEVRRLNTSSLWHFGKYTPYHNQPQT